MSPLVIVLIVLVVMLILGGGGCLLCVGLAASSAPNETPSVTSSSGSTPLPGSNGLVHDAMAIQLETKLKAQGVQAGIVLCPAASNRGASFSCNLTVGADTAALQVTDNGSGFAFEVPNTAFLDASKLKTSFDAQIAAKVGTPLQVPCFTGMLMKPVGGSFACEVFGNRGSAGTLTTTVLDAKGNVRMDFTPKPGGIPATPTPQTATPTKPSAPSGPRVVDFVCPAGKAPGGAVRAGCLCGSEIIGTACGAPGNFTDVTETPRGCRFTCN